MTTYTDAVIVGGGQAGLAGDNKAVRRGPGHMPQPVNPRNGRRTGGRVRLQ
jgi:succinate dehydrogenase/fumarate reductase flavoprotein subunit